MDRLQAMKHAMLQGATSVYVGSAEEVVPRGIADARAAEIIVALRAALAAERRARLAAETRLRSVLAALAKRPPAARPISRPRPVVRALPASTEPEPEMTHEEPKPEIIDGEVIEVENVGEAIRELGGDDEEEYDG